MGFWGDLTGNSQRSDLDQGYARATSDLSANTNRASGYYDKAAADYQPFYDNGLKGQNAYLASLGLGPNGNQGASDAYSAYASNPGLRDAAALGVKYAAQRYNVGPGLNSGAAIAGLGNVSLGYYDQYLNRLAGLGEQGQNAAAGQAGVYENQGNLWEGYGRSLADLDTQHAQGVAGTRGVFAQNLIGAAGAGANLYGALWRPNRLSGDMTGSWGTYGKSWQPIVRSTDGSVFAP